MARTQTQKALSKAKRAGIYCPAQSRKTNDHYAEISQHTRMKPTKQEQLQKVKHKKRLVQGDASFFCLDRSRKTSNSIIHRPKGT
ncbi:hypothetical protein [Paenibacillus ottowii]|uniref:hypothetical protein n=2 Tax=Paenibacillus TaxID=44249 RepID=UPI0007E95E42|nr:MULTISPECIES: hypothetical protein [Paenibacillus]OBA04758.1 hypothetical protein A9P44_16600 [Paenibacillus polymyxa]